jgi:hypothetical protein
LSSSRFSLRLGWRSLSLLSMKPLRESSWDSRVPFRRWPILEIKKKKCLF